MPLSKQQKRDRLNYFGFMLFVITALTVISVYSEDEELDNTTPGRTVEDPESLEITNPDYLEEYFETWEE